MNGREVSEVTKVEFAKLADAMKTYYPSADMLPNKAAMQLWYEELKDLPYEVAVVSLRRHVNTNRFPPTIAEIRTGAVQTVNGIANWADGWEQFRNAVRRFGYYQQEEALACMDEITRTVVRRLGWKELCMSENIMQDRANFRMVYNQEANRQGNEAALPIGLQEQIGRLKGTRNQIEGGSYEK